MQFHCIGLFYCVGVGDPRVAWREDPEVSRYVGLLWRRIMKPLFSIF